MFILIYECNPNLPQDTYTFEFFKHKFKTNKLEIFNMISKKYRKYYIRALFKNNMADNIDNIKSIFKNKFNINLSLNRNEIYQEKFYGLGH